MAADMPKGFEVQYTAYTEIYKLHKYIVLKLNNSVLYLPDIYMRGIAALNALLEQPYDLDGGGSGYMGKDSVFFVRMVTAAVEDVAAIYGERLVAAAREAEDRKTEQGSEAKGV